MKVSLNWLKRYVDISEDPEVLANDLTMFGLNVEECKRLASRFEGVVFGKVLEVKKHPRADKLSLCTVDAGGERPLGIICGASNVRPGLGVAVAVNGAVLPGGLKIKKTKIRGEVSEGMICSEKELEIGEDAEGIMELDLDDKPGVTLEGRLGSNDAILDIEVTPNRPDLLSHIGVAREIAALYKRKLRYPELFSLAPGGEFDLEVENLRDCPRYTAAFIDDVVIAPSPQWMQELLASTGVKPINNIVDVTNFVLMETGQPLHAFDRDKLGGDAILVRRARRNETLVTLDGNKRELDKSILVIADGERPVALAGVMGGLDTEVTDTTSRILLESAMFEPRLVRKASQDFKLETEASYRFEREGDVGVTLTAIGRACKLIEEIGAGRPLPHFAEKLAKDAPVGGHTVKLRGKQANRVMGTHLAATEVASLLGRLELKARVSGESIQVAVPSFRRDIEEEIDLIEEAARSYGYENIGREEASRGNIFSRIDPVSRRNENICDFMASRGFAEVLTTSFMDPSDPANFAWPENDPRCRPMEISNPLTLSQSMLRTSLLPGLLNVVRRNSPAEQDGIRIFEMGKVFIPEGDGGGLPREELHIAIVLTRKAGPLQWISDQRDFDFFDMKGELEALITRLGVSSIVRMDHGSYESQSGFIFKWFIKNKFLAEGGVISRAVAAKYDIDTPVSYFDLLMDSLPSKGPGELGFSRISQYPAVKRDLCVVASDKVTFSDIKNVIVSRTKHLESIRLFDYYRGGHLGDRKRSYTMRLNFRSPAGTLDDSVVDREIEKMLAALHRELHVALRAE